MEVTLVTDDFNTANYAVSNYCVTVYFFYLKKTLNIHTNYANSDFHAINVSETSISIKDSMTEKS